MLNKNTVSEIRTCERIKFDQALYILTMYEKKIRNEIKFDGDKALDAEKEYDEKIVHSWNGKWKIDLTKPLLNCVTSVSPRILLKIDEYEDNDMKEEEEEEEEYIKYNRIMLQFIRRMRAEHEDETNFKLTEIDIEDQNNSKYNVYAVNSFDHFTTAIENICKYMKTKIEENGNDIELEEHDEDNYCFEIGGRIEEILEVDLNIKDKYLKTVGDKKFLNEDLQLFITSCLNSFESIKESDHGSTLITVQPKLDEFTYLLHPLFLPIYAYLLKEKEEQKIKCDIRDKEMEESPFKNFFNSNSSSLSKVVFINLDGYESEFNLEFARCFRKNMLYISFPREDIHASNDMNSIYEQRLYKKIMYNWEKNKMRFDNKGDEESMRADRMYFMTHNIEDYFNSIEKNLYKFDNGYEDLNRNLWVFPLRLNTLNENFNNLIAEDEDDTIEIYESYLILQIFKYFLINQIKEFGGTFIVVSHSGRLNIEDSHFVQIMQELTKLSHYKLVYYPNLTTRFCSEDKKGIDHEMSINGIDYLERNCHEDEDEDEEDGGDNELKISFDFFNKIARFLKISSGTHSLMKNFEEEDLLSKHRNLNVLKRVNRLMEVLGNEYENIERIRFKSNEIDLIPKLYQKDAEKIMKAFEKLVPLFYIELYQLLELILCVCLMPQEKKAFYDLMKYGLDPENVKKNYIIIDLIDFIKDKILVRNVRNENDRQQLVLEKIKKFLNCRKEKHFLEISEEKYEDSVLLYFKTGSNMEMYDNIQEGKPNLNGLVDVSFSSPFKEIKDCLQIFDSTQIHYKLDQSQFHTTEEQTTSNNLIPILIMNHLALERKNVSKFENYCAFMKREVLNKMKVMKSGEQGIEKIYEEKKVKPYPIKFYDEDNREIIEDRFEFRVEWNYYETADYMILYWPQLFNFVEAVSYKMQAKTYSPSILNEFFIGKKEVKNDTVCFYKASIPDDIAPRTGCSIFSHKNLLYILGGFYDRSKNYLELQRDITEINMSNYNHDEVRKLQISNIKNDLYEPITNERLKINRCHSYIRPRREYEFYDLQDLTNENYTEDGVKDVVMVGGVGQNFIHPFSLLTYYYYQLKIEEETGKLLSIKKCIAYNRSIPVNIQRPTKNMGIIKTAIRNKNESSGKSITTKPQLTEPNSYARFRIVYKIEDGQFKYKFQYVFSEKDCKMLKEELRKYEEEKYEVGEVSNIRIEKIEGMNHMFMIEKYGSKQIVHLRLEIDGAEQKEQQFKLTHDSITFLNIINSNYICAIVKHPIFTNDKSLLVECKVKMVENENLSEDEAPYVTLKPVHNELKGDLTLHILEASNVNLIYVLHGHRLYNSKDIYEYQITHNRKSGLKSVAEIKQKKNVEGLMNKSVAKCCFSTFFYKKGDIKNEIICESYMNYEEDGFRVTRVDESFCPSNSVNMCWVLKEPIIYYRFCLLNENNPLHLDRIMFIDYYRQENIRIIVVQYNRKKYLININKDQESLEGNEIVYLLEPATEYYIRCLDEQEYERSTKLHKKPENYNDRGYTILEE